MDDEPAPPRKEYPLSPAKLSKTPSWIMLGFVLGALFVIALPLRKKAPPAIELPPEVARPALPRAPQPLTKIEAVFDVWGLHATWADDTTEVALWNEQLRDFADCFEVRRIAGVNYFRSIPTLTRRIIRHGKPMPESPLQFTETEEQYREWLEHGRTERPATADLRPPLPQPAPTPEVRK